MTAASRPARGSAPRPILIIGEALDEMKDAGMVQRWPEITRRARGSGKPGAEQASLLKEDE